MADTILTAHIQAVGHCLQYFAIISGILLIAGGIFKLKRYGESRTFMSQQHTITAPLMMIICGAALCSFYSVITVMMEALWGQANISGGFDSTVAANYANYVNLFYFFHLLGFGAFIRGCFTLSRHQADSQQGVVGKGLIFIFSGCCMMHLAGLVDLINNFFGASS